MNTTIRHEWITYICTKCNRIRIKSTVPPPGVAIVDWCLCAEDRQ